MLSLFKKYAAILVAGECVIFALCAAFFHDGAKLATGIAAAVVLSIILILYCQVRAVAMHQKLLGLLYVWQQPKRFVEAYTPLTEQKKVRRNILFTVNSYLSNGYAAMGDFEKALELLDNAPQLPESRRDAGRAVITGNRCNAYLYMGETMKAKGQFDKLCKVLDRNKGKAEFKGFEETRVLLGIHLKLIKGEVGENDAAALREALKRPGSAYHKTELRYLLAKVYEAMGEKDFAKSYLEECHTNGGETWIAQQAKQELGE